MTMLAERTVFEERTAFLNDIEGELDVDMDVHVLSLYVITGEDQLTPITFNAESYSALDKTMAEYITEHPFLDITAGDEVPWGRLPRTFRALYSIPE